MLEKLLPEASGADTGGICEYGMDSVDREESALDMDGYDGLLVVW